MVGSYKDVIRQRNRKVQLLSFFDVKNVFLATILLLPQRKSEVGLIPFINFVLELVFVVFVFICLLSEVSFTTVNNSTLIAVMLEDLAMNESCNACLECFTAYISLFVKRKIKTKKNISRSIPFTRMYKIMHILLGQVVRSTI